MHYTIS